MREKHKFPLHFSFPIYQRTKPGFFTGKCVPLLNLPSGTLLVQTGGTLLVISDTLWA